MVWVGRNRSRNLHTNSNEPSHRLDHAITLSATPTSLGGPRFDSLKKNRPLPHLSPYPRKRERSLEKSGWSGYSTSAVKDSWLDRNQQRNHIQRGTCRVLGPCGCLGENFANFAVAYRGGKVAKSATLQRGRRISRLRTLPTSPSLLAMAKSAKFSIFPLCVGCESCHGTQGCIMVLLFSLTREDDVLCG